MALGGSRSLKNRRKVGKIIARMVKVQKDENKIVRKMCKRN